MSFGERLKEVRKQSNLTQVDFADALHVTPAYISRLELDKANPSDMLIKTVCLIWNINEAWLRTGEGRRQDPSDVIYKKLQDVPGEDNSDLRRQHVKYELESSELFQLRSLFSFGFPRIYDMIEALSRAEARDFVRLLNFLIREWTDGSERDKLKIELRIEEMIPERKRAASSIAGYVPPLQRKNIKIMVPVVGRTAAGAPIEMVVNELGSISAGDDVRVGDFGIIAAGDSMIDVGIADGDLCIIRPQESVENGEIALVAVDDSSTIKKFYRENGHYRLVACNSEYNDQVYPASAPVRILGKFIKVARRV